MSKRGKAGVIGFGKALETGMHIIIEKPLAAPLSNCGASIVAAKESGVISATVYQRRFYEPVKRIHFARGRPVCLFRHETVFLTW